MRLKRLMSIVLAAILVMSFAMSASAASTLYHTQNFDYADMDAVKADTGTITATFPKGAAIAVTFAKDGTKSMLSDGIAFFELKTGSTGNKYVERNAANVDKHLYFVPENEWTANANEAYVIAFNYEVEEQDTAAAYHHIGVIGKNSSSAYYLSMVGGWGNKILFSDYSGYGKYETTGAVGTGHNAAPAGVKPFALKFETNPTGGLTRSAYTNDSNGVYSCYYAGSTFDLANFSTIAAFGLNSRSTRAGVSSIRMYTIDTATGFKVTAPIDGTKVTDLSAKTVTLKFTHPVYAAEFSTDAITVTANGEEVNGVTFGDLTTGVVNGEYVSTIDVNLPALVDGKDYVIAVDNTVKNEVADTLVDNTVSFTTPKPDITATITTNSHVQGQMGEANVVVSNNHETSNKSVAVIYAVYAAGKLVDVVYANDTLAPSTTTTISAGVKLSDDATRAKVMLWDGISTINPYKGFVGVDVSAAQ